MDGVTVRDVAAPRPAISLDFQGLPWDRLIDALPVGIYTCDREGRLLQYNDQATSLWGRVPDLLDNETRFGGALRTFALNGDPLPQSETPMAEVLRTGKAVRGRELILEREDGSRIVVVANVEPLFDANGELCGGVNCFQDITWRKQDDLRVRESEHRLKDLLQSLPAAIYTTDLDGNITFYNDAAVTLAGRRPEIGDKWCVTWRLYNPDGTYLPHDQCPMAVALREKRAVRNQEAIAERPDGSRIWFVPYPTPLTDSSGKMVGALNMLVDITHRKSAEQQQKLLIDELNHRVKNTLATVQSLIVQSAATAESVEGYRQTIEARILAMSAAHNQLSRRGWTNADICELVEGAVAPFGDESAISLSGSRAAIPPRAALLLSMVLHELATNATKYGALSVPDGKVAIAWSVIATSTGPALQFSWIESGGPAVAPQPRSGFGTRLVRRGIQMELNGKAELDFAPGGLRCEIELPLDHVQ